MTQLLERTADAIGVSAPWAERNRAALQAEFCRLDCLLDGRPVDPRHSAAHESGDAPPAIDQLTAIFSLTSFERDLLLLAVGMQMDAALAARGAMQHPMTLTRAFAVLPDAHWSALTPARPLRHMRLLDVDTSRGLTGAPLSIDERVLHYIAGSNLLDQRLSLLIEPQRQAGYLSPRLREHLPEMTAALCAGQVSAVLLLHGNDPESQVAIAEAIAGELDRTLLVLKADDLPQPGRELDTLLLLLERELHMLPAAVLLRCSAGGLSAGARRIAERLPAPLLLACPDTQRLDRAFRHFEVNRPALEEQKSLWDAAFDGSSASFEDSLAEISAQFSLSPAAIQSLAAAHGPDPDALWAACRDVARPQLESLAQRIECRAGWNDIVLPEQQMQVLHQLAGQLRMRSRVHTDWGFSANSRGLGISALFAGESGTGKTLAAEVLARELRLDLYRIDLSQVVSKYIGETEKNLRVVFDAADGGGVLLLFDEADALFGKRTEVRDSHDRYANIEVGYLLQRMESYAGVAILTTNLKGSIDRSFQRRLRFILNFPFPDATQREAIWRRSLPPEAPVDAVEYARLAQLNMAGGNIRNIALNAAFLAAGENAPIRMTHLHEAALLEARKIERPLSPAEMKGWL